MSRYGAPDRLLFSKINYASINQHIVIKKLLLIGDEYLRTLVCIFIALCHHKFPINIKTLEKPFLTRVINGYYVKAVDILSEFLIKKHQHPLSIRQVIDGLKQLDVLMRVNGIDYVLTGSLGLYLHGFAPASYIPHDIDIIISNNNNKNPFLLNQMILDLAKQDEWILDGTFIDTLTDRLDRADYIIDLKYSTWTHLKGIFARKIDESKRKDIPKMTLSFAYYVYSYNNVQRPYIDAILKMYDPGKIITFNSRKVLDEYTKTMFIEMGIPIAEIKN